MFRGMDRGSRLSPADPRRRVTASPVPGLHSSQKVWSDSIDIAEVLRPQTLLTYSMNGGDLRVLSVSLRGF
jgi:DMSO/TMAO reductase YedYZ molybdopterin-dependent catalytic subunit